MGMSLSVNRVKLLEQLTVRRDEINAYYDDQKGKLQAALDEMNTSSAAWAEYHRLISVGLANGDYVYDNGKIRPAVPANYRQRKTPTDEHVPLPDKPGSKTGDKWGPRQGIEAALLRIDSYYRAHDLAPYEAAIAMLTLSDDDTTTIEGSNYDRMLSAPIGRDFPWDS